jgi:NAD-reducing hydrogenase small subunit
MAKKILATTSLAGCFGCHMSLLDIDERILELIELVEFDKSPIDDIKTFTGCDVGLIEGGCCNDENVHVLRSSASTARCWSRWASAPSWAGCRRCATRSR